MENLKEALAAGRISEVERTLDSSYDDHVLRAYCRLCRGRPAEARAILSERTDNTGLLTLALFQTIRTFEGSGAIHELPQPTFGGRQSPERQDEIYDELREIPSDLLLSDLQAIEESARHKPANAVLLFQLGEIYGFRKDDPRLGRLYFEAAIQAEPSLGLFWGYTGELVFKKFDVFEAVEYYNNAVLVDPENPRWHLYRSHVLMMVFALSLRDGLLVDPREETRIEAGLAVAKAEALGESFRILKACRFHLRTVEENLQLVPVPQFIELFRSSHTEAPGQIQRQPSAAPDD